MIGAVIAWGLVLLALVGGALGVLGGLAMRSSGRPVDPALELEVEVELERAGFKRGGV